MTVINPMDIVDILVIITSVISIVYLVIHHSGD